jgi:hypothetical protein
MPPPVQITDDVSRSSRSPVAITPRAVGAKARSRKRSAGSGQPTTSPVGGPRADACGLGHAGRPRRLPSDFRHVRSVRPAHEAQRSSPHRGLTAPSLRLRVGADSGAMSSQMSLFSTCISFEADLQLIATAHLVVAPDQGRQFVPRWQWAGQFATHRRNSAFRSCARAIARTVD